MSFVHLHVHTQYSVRKGLCDMDELFSKAKMLGMNALAITDTDSLSGVPKFLLMAKRYPSIKPIIGCELSMEGQRIVLLANNLGGYRNLVKLVSAAHASCFSTSGERISRSPEISPDELEQFRDGLICLSFGNDADIAWLRRVFGGDFYIAVSALDSDTSRRNIIDLAQENGVKLIATNDVRFVEKDDYFAFECLRRIGVAGKIALDAQDRRAGAWFKTEEEMMASMLDCPQAIANSTEIAQKIKRISIEIVEKTDNPNVVVNKSVSREDLPELMERIRERYGPDRVAGVVSYWKLSARRAVKLVAFKLGLPSDERQRLCSLFSADYTCIPMQDFLKVPAIKNEMRNGSEVSREVLKNAQRLTDCIYDIDRNCNLLVFGKEGLDFHVPLGSSPARFADDRIQMVSQYEAFYLRLFDIFELRLLGSNVLSLIRGTVKLIRERTGKAINIRRIPLDDAAVFDLFSRGDTEGVFGFETDGRRRRLKELKPTDIQELIALHILYCPGFMQHIPALVEGGVKAVEAVVNGAYGKERDARQVHDAYRLAWLKVHYPEEFAEVLAEIC